jgi:hypothetical protein
MDSDSATDVDVDEEEEEEEEEEEDGPGPRTLDLARTRRLLGHAETPPNPNPERLLLLPGEDKWAKLGKIFAAAGAGAAAAATAHAPPPPPPPPRREWDPLDPTGIPRPHALAYPTWVIPRVPCTRKEHLEADLQMMARIKAGQFLAHPYQWGREVAPPPAQPPAPTPAPGPHPDDAPCEAIMMQSQCNSRAPPTKDGIEYEEAAVVATLSERSPGLPYEMARRNHIAVFVELSEGMLTCPIRVQRFMASAQSGATASARAGAGMTCTAPRYDTLLHFFYLCRYGVQSANGGHRGLGRGQLHPNCGHRRACGVQGVYHMGYDF